MLRAATGFSGYWSAAEIGDEEENTDQGVFLFLVKPTQSVFDLATPLTLRLLLVARVA